MSIALRWALLSLVVFIHRAPADVTNVRFFWEGSLDQGTTWQAGQIDAPLDAPSILVRARVSWEADEPTYYGQTRFDAVVRLSSSISQDTVSQLPFQSVDGLFFNNQPPITAFRFADIIKIDDPRDAALPGQGTRWLTPYQPPPDIGIPNPSNPITVLRFRLDLDGIPGTRVVDAHFAPTNPPNLTVGIFRRPGGVWQGFGYDAAHIPLTINVIPPGSSLALGVAAMAWAARRRRGA